jgi:hypothetical protein
MPVYNVSLDFMVVVEADTEEDAREKLKNEYYNKQLNLSKWTPQIGDYVQNTYKNTNKNEL